MLAQILSIFGVTRSSASRHRLVNEFIHGEESVQRRIEVLEDREWELIGHVDHKSDRVIDRSDPFVWVSLREDEFHVGIVDVGLDQIWSNHAWDFNKALGENTSQVRFSQMRMSEKLHLRRILPTIYRNRPGCTSSPQRVCYTEQ